MESSDHMNKQTRFAITLAPFQPTTTIELETYVNTSTECYLDIKNLANKKLNVFVTKTPDVKRQITLNLLELEILEKNTGTISIKWSPKEAGYWRDILQLTDSRRIKYDIVMITIAKEYKKKLSKSILQKPFIFSASTANIRYKDNKVSRVITDSELPIINTTAQVGLKQTKAKCENNWNKENILGSCNKIEIYASKGNSRTTVTPNSGHHKSTNILCNQDIWKDGSVLPQVLIPSKMPQEIRRATYVKEITHNSILCKHNKEITEDTTYTNDQSQSNFSVLLDKLTFASTEVTASSPQSIEIKSTELTNSPIIKEIHTERNETYVVNSRTFEISKVPDLEMCNMDLLTVPYLPEENELSFRDNVNNLVASSPIAQLQNTNQSKEDEFKHFIDHVNRSIQIDCEYFSCEALPEDIKAATKAGDLYIEISPPKHSHSKQRFISKSLWNMETSRTIKELPSPRTGKVTKDKILHERNNAKRFQLIVPVAKKNTKNVPAIRISKSSLNVLRQVKTHDPSSSLRESNQKVYNEENSIFQEFEEDLFIPFTTENVFLNTEHDEQRLLQQELIFTKWLNVMLSIPKDLDANVNNVLVNTTIWQMSQSRDNREGTDDILTANKETVSARYHTSNRLHALRKAAYAMFRRKEVMEVNTRIIKCIGEKMLYVRADRNLHRDLCLQKDVLSLFLCYNPLWLRIGLETIYDEYIPLRNNNDIVGLTRFLLERFFTDPRLTKMPGYHKTDPSKKFVTLLNQFILKKFLFLVYFLDYAKQHKLIGHDPCLFHKRAAYKASREILLCFSRELLAGIGDVTKILRAYNYVVTHQQTYIDEYNYAVSNIRNDLRDGVRLCRIVELITGFNGLTRQCRTPAISRLQKVHNVDLALNVLCQAGHVLRDDIDAKSIVDGHREKTVSLLWQIVYKYQLPRFDQAARIIQRWWRSRMWYLCVRNYLCRRRQRAATVIQRAWKHKMKLSSQSITVEQWYFLRIKKAAICLQRWWRILRGSSHMMRLREQRNKRLVAVITLQEKWRATLVMRVQRDRYRDLKNAALTIQMCWRTKQKMKLQRFEYLKKRRNAAMQIYSWWKSIKVMREKREWFLRCRKNARIIQNWWLRHLLMRTVVRTIERWWISVNTRSKYLHLRKSIILIQRTWRKKYQMREQKKRNACLKLQSWWRAVLYSRKYKLYKSCCVKLQCWWRKQRYYLKQRRAVSLIASWYLHARSGRITRLRYLSMKNATIQIQTRWRAKLIARKERKMYQQLRKNVIILQTYWRQRIIAHRDRQFFLTRRKACIILQSWWRMIRINKTYKAYRNCVVTMQRRWRAIKTGHLVRKEYQGIRSRIVIVQTRWRCFAARRRFLACRQAAIIIQSYYRMRIAARWYKNAKRAALIIQSCWRRYTQKKVEKELIHQELVLFTIKIQNEYGQIVDQEAINHMLPSSDYWQEKINMLRNCNSVGTLLICLNSLDSITKLSPTICIIFCQLDLVDEIYKTIKLHNRSQPWMNACRQACSILITLAKYAYTKKYIVKQEHALLLVKLLSDTLKEKEVFLHCATLIWLLCQDEDYVKAMTMHSDITWLLKNIQKKITKDTSTSKSRKLEKSSSCGFNQNNIGLFTNMNLAITAIVKKICI